MLGRTPNGCCILRSIPRAGKGEPETIDPGKQAAERRAVSAALSCTPAIAAGPAADVGSISV